MIEHIKHVNSQGDVLEFNQGGIFTEENELRDYEWSYHDENEYITDFYRGITEKSITFTFYCDSRRASEIRNAFYEHFERDVIDFSKGYFEIGDWRYYCYLTKSPKSSYLPDSRMLQITATITTDQPFWIKEKTYSFSKQDGAVIPADESKTYAYTYSYVYGNGNDGNFSINLEEAMSGSEFRMIIYGAVINPAITIGGHLYSVNVTLDSNEYLEIDSYSRTVYRVTANGTRINVFNSRNKESSIFEKLHEDYSSVSWSGTFGFDIIAYEERSEPEWS